MVDFYESNVFIGQAERNTLIPTSFNIGLNVLGRFYYQWNNWSFGVDFYMGLLYQQSNPNQSSTSRVYDENYEILDEETLEFFNENRQLGTVQDFSIGIQYHFSLKRKTKEDS